MDQIPDHRGMVRRPGYGRLRCTTSHQDRYIRKMALRHCQETARALQMDFYQATGVRISNQTVQNRLHGDNLYSRRLVRGTILLPQHRGHRLEFALDQQNWQLHHWRQCPSQMGYAFMFPPVTDVEGMPTEISLNTSDTELRP